MTKASRFKKNRQYQGKKKKKRNGPAYQASLVSVKKYKKLDLTAELSVRPSLKQIGPCLRKG